MDAGRDMPMEPDDTGARARPENLRAIADVNQEATFGDGSDDDGTGGLARLPGAGLITGEVGPKGQVSSQLRGLSRIERSSYGHVPRGTVVEGGGRYIFLLVLGLLLVCGSLILLLVWLTR